MVCPIYFYPLLFLFFNYNLISVLPAYADSSFSIYCISNGDGTANCTRDDNQLSITCVGSPGATVECTSKDNNKYECVPLSIAQTGQIQVQLSCSPAVISSFGNFPHPQTLLIQIHQNLLLKNHLSCYLILSTKIYSIKFLIRQELILKATNSMIPFKFI